MRLYLWHGLSVLLVALSALVGCNKDQGDDFIAAYRKSDQLERPKMELVELNLNQGWPSSGEIHDRSVRRRLSDAEQESVMNAVNSSTPGRTQKNHPRTFDRSLISVTWKGGEWLLIFSGLQSSNGEKRWICIEAGGKNAMTGQFANYEMDGSGAQAFLSTLYAPKDIPISGHAIWFQWAVIIVVQLTFWTVLVWFLLSKRRFPR